MGGGQGGGESTSVLTGKVFQRRGSQQLEGPGRPGCRLGTDLVTWAKIIVTGDQNNRLSRLAGRKGPKLDWRGLKGEWEERHCRLGGETTLAGLLHKGKKKSEAAVAGGGTGVLRGVLFTCFSFKMR